MGPPREGATRRQARHGASRPLWRPPSSLLGFPFARLRSRRASKAKGLAPRAGKGARLAAPIGGVSPSFPQAGCKTTLRVALRGG